MPSFCLSKWEKGNETDKESRDTDRGKKKERERGEGVPLSGETVPSLDTAEKRYDAAKTQIVEEHLKHNFFSFYKTEAHLLSGLFYKHKFEEKGIEIPFMCSSEEEGGELHMAEWK